MNLELLKTILKDFSADELETEIFTLNEVLVATPANAKVSASNKATRKTSGQTMTEQKLQRNPTQPTGKQQLVLNEK